MLNVKFLLDSIFRFNISSLDLILNIQKNKSVNPVKELKNIVSITGFIVILPCELTIVSAGCKDSTILGIIKIKNGTVTKAIIE